MHHHHILYHAHCPDGFAASFIAWLWNSNRHASQRQRLHFHAVTYDGSGPPTEITGSESVTILDFCYPGEVLDSLRERCFTLRVFDHHQSRREVMLSRSDYCTFAADKCGARLAWEHFFPGQTTPMWLDQIEHRDLGKAFDPDLLVAEEMPMHEAFHAGLWRGTERNYEAWARALGYVYRHDFGGADWRLADNEWMAWFMPVAKRGTAILLSDEQMMQALLEQEHYISVANFRVPAINTPLLQSELGNQMCRRRPGAPFSVCYAKLADGRWRYSLRSRRGDGMDVSVVAANFGGGGHRHAAGFTVEDML